MKEFSDCYGSDASNDEKYLLSYLEVFYDEEQKCAKITFTVSPLM